MLACVLAAPEWRSTRHVDVQECSDAGTALWYRTIFGIDFFDHLDAVQMYNNAQCTGNRTVAVSARRAKKKTTQSISIVSISTSTNIDIFSSWSGADSSFTIVCDYFTLHRARLTTSQSSTALALPLALPASSCLLSGEAAHLMAPSRSPCTTRATATTSLAAAHPKA